MFSKVTILKYGKNFKIAILNRECIFSDFVAKVLNLYL